MKRLFILLLVVFVVSLMFRARERDGAGSVGTPAPDSVGCAKAKQMGYKALEYCSLALTDESERERHLRKADDHLLILKHYAADDHCACYKVDYNNNKARRFIDQALSAHVKDSVKIYVEWAIEKINGVIGVIQRCEYENRTD
jgi:hypothetical protein